LDVIADRQAWCLAALVLDRRGDRAFEEAVQHAQSAIERRDVTRFEIWAEVATLIREMQRPRGDYEAVN
jgi:hypothetical protein